MVSEFCMKHIYISTPHDTSCLSIPHTVHFAVKENNLGSVLYILLYTPEI